MKSKKLIIAIIIFFIPAIIFIGCIYNPFTPIIGDNSKPEPFCFDFAEKYKNNPEGFFNFIKSLWADTVDYDKNKGIIKVNEKIRNTCNCPFIREKEAPGILCECSLGTQKRIYECLFDKKVNVTLEKSVLRGMRDAVL